MNIPLYSTILILRILLSQICRNQLVELVQDVDGVDLQVEHPVQVQPHILSQICRNKYFLHHILSQLDLFFGQLNL